MTPEWRRWCYRVAVGVIVILVTYGVVRAEHVDLWMSLLTAALAVPLITADRHIPDTDPDDTGQWRRGKRVS